MKNIYEIIRKVIHRELDLNSWQMKPSYGFIHLFSNDLVPNGIPFAATSVGKM